MEVNLSWSKTELLEHLKGVQLKYEYDQENLLDDDMVLAITLSKADALFKAFNNYIARWFYYLSIYISIQDYETCAQLRNVISIEEEQFIKLINSYRPDIIKDNPSYLKDISNLIKFKYQNVTNTFAK